MAIKATKERSPSYPFISLKVAVQRLQQLEAKFGRHPAPANKAGIAWDLTAGSSQAYQTLAALKAYGLLAYEGTGDDRVAVITDSARDYLRAQQDHIKKAVLKDCALQPKAIAKYWDMWGADRPPDEVCLDELVLKGRFTQSAAETFLRVYDDTIAYAGLSDSDTHDDDFEEEDEMSASTPEPPRSAKTSALPSRFAGGGKVIPLNEPYRISATPNGLEGAFKLESLEDAEQLIRVIDAMKTLLPKAEEV